METSSISQKDQNEQLAFSIRALTNSDEGCLQRFIKRFNATDRRFFSFLEHRNLRQLLDPNSFWTVLCVFQGDEVIGYAHLERFRQLEKRHVARLGIIVDAGARQQGVGRRLTLKLLEKAGEMGVEKIWLSVLADNSRAIALYQSVGFRPEGIFIDEERGISGRNQACPGGLRAKNREPRPQPSGSAAAQESADQRSCCGRYRRVALRAQDVQRISGAIWGYRDRRCGASPGFCGARKTG